MGKKHKGSIPFIKPPLININDDMICQCRIQTAPTAGHFFFPCSNVASNGSSQITIYGDQWLMMPRAGRIQNMGMALMDTGTLTAVRFRIAINGTDTGLECTVPAGEAYAVNDVYSHTFNAGDGISVHHDASFGVPECETLIWFFIKMPS